MIAEHGLAMIEGMDESGSAYWARRSMASSSSTRFGCLTPDTNARRAEAPFNGLRAMLEAPAILMSCDLCKVVGQA
jgi:hypothetical protein